MKRSEVVELIRTLIPDEFSIETLDDQKDIASYILKRLEDVGMMPPFVYNLYLMDFHKYGIGGASGHKWEPEDEAK